MKCLAELYCPTACGGEGGGEATKGGPLFPRAEGAVVWFSNEQSESGMFSLRRKPGCEGFLQTGGEAAHHNPQRQSRCQTLEPSSRRPVKPRPEGPSTLTPARACPCFPTGESPVVKVLSKLAPFLFEGRPPPPSRRRPVHYKTAVRRDALRFCLGKNYMDRDIAGSGDCSSCPIHGIPRFLLG